MSAPFFYDHINAVNGEINPSTVHSQNAFLTRYFKRYLLQRASGVFKFTLPEGWEQNYFVYCLYMLGRVAVIETDKFGIIPQDCGLYGHGVQYQPTHATITNPLLEGLLRPEIGSECAVIRLMPDWGGIMDIVNEYAEALALCSEAESFNLQNSKLAFVYGASGKNMAETFKKLYDEISKGNPAAFVHKDLFNEQGELNVTTFNAELDKNFIALDLLDVRRRLLCMFDSAVGIDSNLAYDKKERINTAEVSANNAETYLNASIWLDEIKKGIEQANDLFGLSLAVDWRVKPARGEEAQNNAAVAADTV